MHRIVRRSHRTTGKPGLLRKQSRRNPRQNRHPNQPPIQHPVTRSTRKPTRVHPSLPQSRNQNLPPATRGTRKPPRVHPSPPRSRSQNLQEAAHPHITRRHARHPQTRKLRTLGLRRNRSPRRLRSRSPVDHRKRTNRKLPSPLRISPHMAAHRNGAAGHRAGLPTHSVPRIATACTATTQLV